MNVSRYCVVLAIGMFLSGCNMASQTIGLSEREWQFVPYSQRLLLLSQHVQNQSQWCRADRLIDTTAPGIIVHLISGRAQFWPGKMTASMMPTEFRLIPGDCQSVVLNAPDENHQTTLRVYYDGNAVILDPLFYEFTASRGTLEINKHPAWKDGMTYTGLSTRGYASMTRLVMNIHEDI
ncbi:MAG: hypothetical protein CMF46_04315 [Legionellales bacterium]|nr:hypothetical protein [Legionellales bacterium]|tara:strand:- start:1436 stop:1972 length:537 start_codon:yes stop_codon:yes gene_type:complete